MKILNIFVFLLLLIPVKATMAEYNSETTSMGTQTIVPSYFTVTTSQAVPQSNKSNNLKEVLAVDMDYDQNLNNKTIHQGQDAILLYHAEGGQRPVNTTNPNLKEFNYISDHQSLSLLDEELNGRIDSNDKTFQHIYLLYKQGDHYKIYSAKELGIRAFLLPKAYIKADPSISWENITNQNVAIMSDGSTRRIVRVLVEHELLQ